MAFWYAKEDGFWWAGSTKGPSWIEDVNVDLETYIYRDATNTGLAGVGLTEADLTEYTGDTEGVVGPQTIVIEDKIINSYFQLNPSVHLTLRRCKVNGHVDSDSPLSSFRAEDCDLDAGIYTNANIGFRNLTIKRCNINGGITSVNANGNVLVEDSYCHGQYVEPEMDTHTGAIAVFGGSNITIRRTTIHNDSLDNGFGGGPTGNFQILNDDGYVSDVLIEHCWIPATEGGYSVGLGYNPGWPTTGKEFGDNVTKIVFRHNIFGRRAANGKGGVFGTVTSWLPDSGNGVLGAGNLYYDNIWQDTGEPVIPNE